MIEGIISIIRGKGGEREGLKSGMEGLIDALRFYFGDLGIIDLGPGKVQEDGNYIKLY